MANIAYVLEFIFFVIAMITGINIFYFLTMAAFLVAFICEKRS